MNKVQELFDDMTDEEVRQGIEEIKESEVNGIIPDGIVREYSRKMKEITGGNTLDLLQTIMSILKQGAFRWNPTPTNPEDNKDFLILSGEGNWVTEHQFVMSCSTLEEAKENFRTFKNGTYSQTYLMIYEGKKLKEE